MSENDPSNKGNEGGDPFGFSETFLNGENNKESSEIGDEEYTPVKDNPEGQERANAEYAEKIDIDTPSDEEFEKIASELVDGQLEKVDKKIIEDIAEDVGTERIVIEKTENVMDEMPPTPEDTPTPMPDVPGDDPMPEDIGSQAEIDDDLKRMVAQTKKDSAEWSLTHNGDGSSKERPRHEPSRNPAFKVNQEMAKRFGQESVEEAKKFGIK